MPYPNFTEEEIKKMQEDAGNRSGRPKRDGDDNDNDNDANDRDDTQAKPPPPAPRSFPPMAPALIAVL